ncbi:MAG: SCP2 sterol-binding domain-containing protein [Pseudomonadales bacterium]|nr:SCP2 sterol-binding domain-containing protein [Pseudomonadales bacterium]
MSLKFLSEEWFAKVAELKAAAGEIEVPAALHDLIINITVTGTDFGDVDICMNAGMIEQGHHDSAPTKMILPVDLAHRLFIDNDQSAGMQGFMSGQIKIEGDMSKLMAMQTVQPSDDQKALQKAILEATSS